LRSDGYLGRETAVLVNEMLCSSSWRPPRRTAFAGRLGLLFCLVVLGSGVSAGPAAAYSCDAAASSRSPAGHILQKKDCNPEPARTTRRGNADPMSFVFFMGVVIAFVVVPFALSRREEHSRE
jgi:hypothetical protein